MVEEEGEEGSSKLPIKFASVIDRYYTRNYLKVRPTDIQECLNQQEPEEQGDICLDQFYHMHSNKLILFGLSPNHVCIQQH
jgi:hypothetical protein